jgi:hypothetical protein
MQTIATIGLDIAKSVSEFMGLMLGRQLVKTALLTRTNLD